MGQAGAGPVAPLGAVFWLFFNYAAVFAKLSFAL